MNKLFRSNSSTISRFRSSIRSLQDIVNEEDYTAENNNNDYSNWNIPKISKNEVYKTYWVQSTFKTEYKVKTVEHTFLLVKLMKNITYLVKKPLKALDQEVITSYT